MRKYSVISVLATLFMVNFSQAQNTGIGTTTPASSAMLDVSSNSKGLLIPRVSLTGLNDNTTVPGATNWLLVFNTATAGSGGNAVSPGMYYRQGAAWVMLQTINSPGVDWKFTGNAGTVNSTHFIGTTDNVPFNVRVNNVPSGKIDHIDKNVFWGYEAGQDAVFGGQLTAIGHQALTGNLGSRDNTAIGYRALASVIYSSENTAVGSLALEKNILGNANTAVGFSALDSNTDGRYNVGLGAFALRDNTTGESNIAVGNNALQGNVDGAYNVAIGYTTLANSNASDNIAIGSRAMLFSESGHFNVSIGSWTNYVNSSGSQNTALGTNALRTNTTSNSTAIGANAMYSNTSGNNNTALGSDAMRLNNTGYSNTAGGRQSMEFNTSGFQNTATGFVSLQRNTTGFNGTAFGAYALQFNTDGESNTGIGISALRNNSTGNENVAIGHDALTNNNANNNTAVGAHALVSNTTGTNNTAIGYLANAGANNLTNATAIGANATVSGSNRVRIGNSAVIAIEGAVDFSVASDARFKYNVRENVPGLDFITKLKPVTYYFDAKKLDDFTRTGVISNDPLHTASYPANLQLQSGFLAQDVEKVAKELGYDFSGVHGPQNEKDHYTLGYSQFVMPLVKGMQEQQAIIDAQEKRIAGQEQKLSDMQLQIDALKKLIAEKK